MCAGLELLVDDHVLTIGGAIPPASTLPQRFVGLLISQWYLFPCCGILFLTLERIMDDWLLLIWIEPAALLAFACWSLRDDLRKKRGNL